MDEQGFNMEPEDKDQTNQHSDGVYAETETPNAPPPPAKSDILKKELIEWGQAVAIAVILALVIRTFIFTLVKVDGTSMLPTLEHSERLFVVRLFYKPKPGDIIIFRPRNSPSTPYVKRAIALPGQTVDIDFNAGVVYVDGKALDEPYIREQTRSRGDLNYPITVPQGSLFAMGDNRNNSRDSRFSEVGLVDYSSIIGKAIFRLWPFTAIGPVK